MSRKSALLSEELAKSAAEELKKIGKNALVARKLEAIIAACKYGITEVAKIYDVTHTTLRFWCKNFIDSKTERLKAPPTRHRKSILNDSDRGVVRGIIGDNPQITINVLRVKVKEILGKEISRSSLHREVQKLGYSHITPRPQHYKNDKDEAEAFKKKSTKS